MPSTPRRSPNRPTLNNIIGFLDPASRARLRMAGLRNVPITKTNVLAHAMHKVHTKKRGYNRLQNLAGTLGRVGTVFPNTVREEVRKNLNLTRPQMNRVVSALRSGFGVNVFYNTPAHGRKIIRNIVHMVRSRPSWPGPRGYNFGWEFRESGPRNLTHGTNGSHRRAQVLYGGTVPPLNFRQISHSRLRTIY